MSKKSRTIRSQCQGGGTTWRVGGALRGSRLHLLSALLTSVAIFLPGPAASATERHALLIGISKYQYISSLEGPRNDAEALRRALIEEWSFDPAHVEMLLDEEATRTRIEAGLTALFERTKPGDHVLIYFSGHGTSRLDVRSPWPLPDETGALIPADFKSDGSLERQTRRLIVGRTDLRPVLEKLDQNGRRVFVIVDSCFSGNAVRSLSAVLQMPLRYVALTDPKKAQKARKARKTPASPMPEVLRGAPQAAYPYQNVTFLAASGEHEAATDIGRALLTRFPTSDGQPHGALTDAMLRVLTGRVRADSNSDGRLTYDELYRGVRHFMDERGYPHSPRLLPDAQGDLAALVGRAVFELSNVPTAEWATVGEDRLRVEFASDLKELESALSGSEELEFTSKAPDIVISRDAGEILLAAPGGDPLDRLDDEKEQLRQRLHREVVVRRLLRMPSTEGGFNVTVDLSAPRRTTVLEGEPIAFTVTTEKPAYILMLGIDQEANVRVLYPSRRGARPEPVSPLAPLTVPGIEPSSQVSVEPPFGIEYIVVAAVETAPDGLTGLARMEIGPDSPMPAALERVLDDAEEHGAKASLRFRTVAAGVSQ